MAVQLHDTNRKTHAVLTRKIKRTTYYLTRDDRGKLHVTLHPDRAQEIVGTYGSFESARQARGDLQQSYGVQ